MDRTVLHCDCNSFFASVETVLDPSLADGPMAVCGNPENRHGIILAKNEQAKKFGVKTAEPIFRAQQKCPGLKLVQPHYDVYGDFSRRANAIYREYTDLVEPFGMDEAWLDVTASRLLFGDGPKIADELRGRFRKELGLTASVGVSFNKVFAKLGSDYKKPDATTVITRENYRRIVWPLPVEALLFAGARVTEALNSMGISTVGDLAALPPALLEKRFGKSALLLSRYARGEDDSPVADIYTVVPPKSIGNGRTFRRDLLTETDIRTGTLAVTELLTARMRRHGVKCSTLTVALKFADFTTASHRCTLDFPSNLTAELYAASLRLLFSFYHYQKPIRSITITGSQLSSDNCSPAQMCLFDNGAQKHEKQERVEDAVARIRAKYGAQSVQLGEALLETDIR